MKLKNKYSTKTIKVLHAIAKEMLDGNIAKDNGICGNVSHYGIFRQGICTKKSKKEINDCLQYLLQRFHRLQHGKKAGNSSMYPLGNGSNDYINARSRGTLWTKHSKYGRERWAALQFIFDETQ